MDVIILDDAKIFITHLQLELDFPGKMSYCYAVYLCHICSIWVLIILSNSRLHNFLTATHCDADNTTCTCVYN